MVLDILNWDGLVGVKLLLWWIVTFLTGLSLMGDNKWSLESLLVVLEISEGATTSSLNTSSFSSSVSTPDSPPLPLESVLDLCELDPVPDEPSLSPVCLLP